MSVLIGLTATMAPTIGPTLGGWLTEVLLLALAVPDQRARSGLVVAGCGVDVASTSTSRTGRCCRSFDLTGLTLMAVFLGTLEYVLEEGTRNDWFEDDTITAFGVTAAVAGVLFLWRMLSRRDPMVDLRSFGNANFSFGCLFSLVLGLGLYGTVYVIPLFLGRVRDFNSMQIGETMFVTGVAMFVASPIAGKLAGKVDQRRMLAFGLFAFGTALFWMGHLTNQSSFWELLLPQTLRGFSLMFIMIPVNQLALGTLPPHQLKNASGLYNLMRNLGGAIGLALINVVATSRAAVHTQHLDELVTWSRPGAANTVQQMTWAMQPAMNGQANQAALARIAAMVRREALTLTYNDVLMLMAVAFFLALPLTLLLKRPRLAPAAGAH